MQSCRVVEDLQEERKHLLQELQPQVEELPFPQPPHVPVPLVPGLEPFQVRVVRQHYPVETAHVPEHQGTGRYLALLDGPEK